MFRSVHKGVIDSPQRCPKGMTGGIAKDFKAWSQAQNNASEVMSQLDMNDIVLLFKMKIGGGEPTSYL